MRDARSTPPPITQARTLHVGSGFWRSAPGRLAIPLVVCAALAGCASPNGGGASRSYSDSSQQAVLTDTLARMSRGSEARHDYAKAAQQYARLLETEPGNESYLLGLARNLRYAGQPHDAVTVLRRATVQGLASETTALRLELTRAMLAAGLLRDAASSLNSLRASAPGDSRILGLAGILSDREGRHAEAQTLYRQALASDPDNLRVANNLALSLAISGRLDQAIGLQEQTVQSSQATVQMRQNLAMFYALAGRMDEAEALTRATLPQDYAEQVIGDLRNLQAGAAPIPRPSVQDAPGSS